MMFAGNCKHQPEDQQINFPVKRFLGGRNGIAVHFVKFSSTFSNPSVENFHFRNSTAFHRKLPRLFCRGFGRSYFSAGSVKKNVAPLPSSLFTQTLPPWFCTMCLTMDKPRPVPPCSRDRALSTR